MGEGKRMGAAPGIFSSDAAEMAGLRCQNWVHLAPPPSHLLSTALSPSSLHLLLGKDGKLNGLLMIVFDQWEGFSGGERR